MQEAWRFPASRTRTSILIRCTPSSSLQSAFVLHRLIRLPLPLAGLVSSRGRFFAVSSDFKVAPSAARSSSARLVAALSSLFSPNRTTIALSRRVEADTFPLNKASSS